MPGASRGQTAAISASPAAAAASPNAATHGTGKKYGVTDDEIDNQPERPVALIVRRLGG